ncbi:hypothetical protein FRC14_007348 [Serendipita sp. 396]|nr:hypothetical protein FRC14_007348 [Serendipita sp. 396]KAG8779677.1 hypothetical protein FRC15_009999 [Serendipita sp. 397]KAG8794353.1 hypothetical protein FRC16_010560 [Serendipita sp. 398]KAG8828155.1 hypothetical protein FRC19_009239 [Serendipita sp. 401]KAG8848612.1 hypothetical protein FRB91_010657 [Serendipita sp. 411]KAG9058460.1 hypothetical protein FS842_009528 [Serendipita sp. 407]
MRLQSWSLLATTLALLSTKTKASGGAQFNAANSLSQILFWDDNWELTPDGGIMTKNGTLIIMANAYEFFLNWAHPNNTKITYGVTMDGHGINPFRDTSSILGTNEVNGTIWNTLQVGIRDKPGDHQLQFWVANPGGVIFTNFNVSFAGKSALPLEYGRSATVIPIDAVAVDSSSTLLNFSPEGWHHMGDCAFCDQRTLANSSTLGSWVQFTISAKSYPSFWIYGVKAKGHSLANLRVTGYKDGSMIYDGSRDVVVGGFDNGEDSQGLVYQDRLASEERLNEADFYRVNMTLIKGTLGIDFIRSTNELLPYDTPLIPTPSSIPTQSNDSKQLQIILLSTLLPSGVALLLLGAWLVWRYHFSATAKKNKKGMPVYIGTMMKERKEIEPYVVSPSDPSRSSSSTMAVSPLDEKRGIQYGHSPTTIRFDQSSDLRPHRDSPTSSFGHSFSSRLSGEPGTGVNTLDVPQSTISSSLLFSNTTISRDGEEEPPMALSHEDLARVFDRVTELKAVQGQDQSERAAVLARRQPEALETLARQIAGIY